jgi:hypothetical protein
MAALLTNGNMLLISRKSSLKLKSWEPKGSYRIFLWTCRVLLSNVTVHRDSRCHDRRCFGKVYEEPFAKN